MQRLRSSWTRWSRRRAERKVARLRAKLAPALVPLLQEQLEILAQPMVLQMDSLQKLDQQQRALSQQLVLLPQTVEARVTVLRPELAELKELLVEVLNSLQPPPELEIASLLSGPGPRATSPRSSES